MTKKNPNRHLRIAHELQSVIAGAILYNRENISGIKSEIITVSKVIMSSDRRYANVYFAIISNNKDEREGYFEILKNNISVFKNVLRREMKHLRYQPELRFYLDNNDICYILNELDN